MTVVTVIGGQYGSEGKGVIANYLSPGVDIAVRTGGPNAGHSIIHEGRVWKMRSVPVAWTNPETILVIGRAGIIHRETLDAEVDALEEAGYSIRNRLFIDKRVMIQIADDFQTDRANVERIGSTGEGIGPTRIRRMERDIVRWETADALLDRYKVVNTTDILRHHIDDPRSLVLLEGTQGFGLSLTHGTWPHVTTNDITVQQMWNDAGIFPYVYTTLMVFRSYPIRVAGPSGPMYREMTWGQMSEKLGKEVSERTTVTNKVRRIGEFDWPLAVEAVRVNRPNALALTFADYIDPKVEGATHEDQLTQPVLDFVAKMEDILGVPVDFIGTGGPEWSVIPRNEAATIMHRRDPRQR